MLHMVTKVSQTSIDLVICSKRNKFKGPTLSGINRNIGMLAPLRIRSAKKVNLDNSTKKELRAG